MNICAYTYWPLSSRDSEPAAEPLKEGFPCHCRQVLARGGNCWVAANDIVKSMNWTEWHKLVTNKYFIGVKIVLVVACLWNSWSDKNDLIINSLSRGSSWITLNADRIVDLKENWLGNTVLIDHQVMIISYISVNPHTFLTSRS